jgi:methylenetetrahydrofolate dehydrogenase (NADP+)/methenyltetrahydrofolate cyclohydrolase
MTLILDGKCVALDIQHKLKTFFGVAQYRWSYVAIFLLGDDHSGLTYVRLKHAFAQSIGLGCRIYGTHHLSGDGLMYNLDTIMQQIASLNTDPECIGIVVQQPLPSLLQDHKAEILASIVPSKDCDGLGGILFGLDSISYIDFIPATPAATINLLAYYQLEEMRGRVVTILGQSNLIGKPLAMYCIKQWATVISLNSKTDVNYKIQACRQSDYIFSATGVVHMIDHRYLSESGQQIVIDIGRWLSDGKAVWDVNRKDCVGKCRALAKVPGGVWPVTVASLFDNIRILQSYQGSKKVFF